MTQGGSVFNATVDALEYKPDEPAWFWFTGTPAPIHEGDSDENLLSRWSEWREAYHRGADVLLSKLSELSQIE